MRASSEAGGTGRESMYSWWEEWRELMEGWWLCLRVSGDLGISGAMEVEEEEEAASWG